MRLHHFLKACYAIDDVEKKGVKISLWMDVKPALCEELLHLTK